MTYQKQKLGGVGREDNARVSRREGRGYLRKNRVPEGAALGSRVSSVHSRVSSGYSSMLGEVEV